MNRRRQFALLALLLSVTLGATACANTSSKTAGVSLWAEFLTYDEVGDELGFLARHELGLNLTVVRTEVDWDAVAAVFAKAERKGVPVSLWPELPLEEGRWPNERNLDLFIPFWNEMLAEVEARDLHPEALWMDLELGYDRVLELGELEESGASIAEIVTWFSAGIDEERHDAATSLLVDLVDDAHARGFLVNATTLPLILDDFADGDATIQKMLDIPLEGIDWDQVSFQVYRSIFSGLFGSTAGLAEGEMFEPYLVYEYGREAVIHFGDRAALDLGAVGGEADELTGTAGYEDPLQLHADFEAALAAGVPYQRMQIFSLDGFTTVDDPDAWLDVPGDLPDTATPPPEDPAVASLRSTFELLDLLGD